MADPNNSRPTVPQFTVRPKGYYLWYKGAARYVCAISVPPDQVLEKWIEKKKLIDQGTAKTIAAPSGNTTLRELAAAYLNRQLDRVLTRYPRPLSSRTKRDGSEIRRDISR